MFRYFRSRLRQIHKRKGFLLVSLAAVISLTALGITIFASLSLNRIAGTSLLRIRPETGASSVPVLGSGLDLAVLPDTNMLRDPSFEPYVFKTSFIIEDGSGSVIAVPNARSGQGIYGEGFFSGADVTVTRLDDTGVVVKKTGKVVKYSPDRLASFLLSPVTGDIPEESKLMDITVRDGLVVAVGDNGIIINGINSQSPSIIYSGVSSAIISVTNNSKTFYACTEEGLILSSPDGSVWSIRTPPENIELSAIAASEDAVIAVGRSGRFLIGDDQVLYSRELGIDEDITDIVYDGKDFVMITEDGTLFASESGIVWRKVTETGLRSGRIKFRDSLYTLTDPSGSVRVYEDIGGEPLSEYDFEEGIVDVAAISAMKIIVLCKDGKLYETGDYGRNWTEVSSLPPAACSMIGAVGDEQVVCSENIRSTYISRLVTEIELDSPLNSGEFEAGEVCYLSISYPEIPDSYKSIDLTSDKLYAWEFYGDGSAVRAIDKGAPSGGNGIMKLSPGDDYGVISQIVSPQNTGRGLTAGEFYIFTVWIRQDDISQQSVKVWLSGDYETFGTEFTNIGTQWNKYTYKFSVPRGIPDGDDSDIRINIGSAGGGDFYLDNAYLGEVVHGESHIPDSFDEFINETDPRIVRLSWLGIGCVDSSQNSWAANAQLEEGLTTVYSQDRHSAPWIVVDSHSSGAEIRNLLEYLAGPISSEYGSIRHKNGSALPWNNRFEKIYLEFTDDSRIYDRDILKAAYIDSCIQTVQDSPYYSGLRNVLVFVDGMIYDDGLMLSRADYFSLGYTFKQDEIILMKIKSDLDRFVSFMPRNPDRPSDTPFAIMKSTDRGEYADEFDTADLVVLMMNNVGRQTAGSLLTWDMGFADEIPDAYRAAARIVFGAVSGERVPLTVESQTADTGAISCYAFADGPEMIFVVTSHDNSPSAVMFDFPFEGRKASVVRFDGSGRMIEQREVRRSNKSINIMPGNVLVFTLAEGDDEK